MDIETIGSELSKEQSRCRELLIAYEWLGLPGLFGHMLISKALKKADDAVISGDPVEMIRAYAELKTLE